MKQHLYSMDVLRAFCAIQVFFLHYVAGINHRELIPLFCGAVPTFLLMSAYLYGMRGDSISYNLAFMKKRFFSLSTSYYPFILVTFLSYLFIDGYSDKLLQGFIVDFLYLGTIGADYNLPHCGHLWFLSILMLCYIALVVCSKIKLVKRTMTNRTGIISVFIIVALLGFVYRGALLIWLFFYLLVYYNAPKLLKIGGVNYQYLYHCF